MGLLDDLQSGSLQSSPLFSMGLGLLAAGGPRMDGAGGWQRLMEGIQSGQAMQDAQVARQLKQLQLQRLAEETPMQENPFSMLPGQVGARRYRPASTAAGAAPSWGQMGSGAFGIAPIAPGRSDISQR